MFSIKEIKDITNALVINGNENIIIEKFNVSIKNHYKNDFYIPIFWKEDRQKYIIEAVKLEAIGFMVSSQYEEKDKIIQESIKINPNIIILQVEDINNAIYEMANYKRIKHIDVPIIAVTGSVGKTSITAMISSIIREEKKVLTDTGNNNVKPLLSWLMLDIEDYEIAVLEVGIGSKNVMEPISKLLRPSIVVINNIGTSHIEKLKSQQGILEEKLKITNYMKDNKIVFLNDDDELLKTVNLDSSYKIQKYSFEEARNVKQNKGIISFKTEVYGKNTEFNLNAYGNHNVSNAICAIRIAETLNIKKESIQKGIENYTSVDRRFEIIRKNNSIIIDDAYNASVDSMRAGLISANQITECKRRIAVLGEMLELGDYSKKSHKKVGEIFKEVNFDILLTQGINTQYICDSAKKYMGNKTVINFENQEELIQYLLKEMNEGDLIYLKASKKMNFDKIVKTLIIGENK